MRWSQDNPGLLKLLCCARDVWCCTWLDWIYVFDAKPLLSNRLLRLCSLMTVWGVWDVWSVWEVWSVWGVWGVTSLNRSS